VNQGWVYGAHSQWLTASNYDGPELHTDATNYKTILNYSFNGSWAVKALGGAREVQSESFEDFTNIPYRMFEGENTNIIHEATGEGQLLFTSDRLNGTTGIYYYNDFRRWRRNNWFGNELKANVDPANNADAKAFLGIPPFVPVPTFIADVDDLDFFHIHGLAGFTEWTYKLFDQLSLTAGVLRTQHQREHQRRRADRPGRQWCVHQHRATRVDSVPMDSRDHDLRHLRAGLQRGRRQPDFQWRACVWSGKAE
jgi:hypothetical protein